MNTVTLKAPAKVNLTLDVTGKRADGYHEIETIFQTVSVYDTLTLTLQDIPGITLHCTAPGVPCDERNLAWKAAVRYLAAADLEASGVSITLEKHIPSQAGLGGGSSDAAAVLYGLNELHGAPLSRAQLCEIAVTLGADVPFFLYGGTAFASGIGEKLEELPALSGYAMVIAKGSDGISTVEAYRAIDALTAHPMIETQQLCAAIRSGAVMQEEFSHCGNLFEAVTTLPDVAAIREAMLQQGAITSCMSGSGAAVYGIFPDTASAKRCAAALQQHYAFAEACTMTATGICTVEA